MASRISETTLRKRQRMELRSSSCRTTGTALQKSYAVSGDEDSDPHCGKHRRAGSGDYTCCRTAGAHALSSRARKFIVHTTTYDNLESIAISAWSLSRKRLVFAWPSREIKTHLCTCHDTLHTPCRKAVAGD